MSSASTARLAYHHNYDYSSKQTGARNVASHEPCRKHVYFLRSATQSAASAGRSAKWCACQATARKATPTAVATSATSLRRARDATRATVRPRDGSTAGGRGAARNAGTAGEPDGCRAGRTIGREAICARTTAGRLP